MTHFYIIKTDNCCSKKPRKSTPQEIYSDENYRKIAKEEHMDDWEAIIKLKAEWKYLPDIIKQEYAVKAQMYNSSHEKRLTEYFSRRLELISDRDLSVRIDALTNTELKLLEKDISIVEKEKVFSVTEINDSLKSLIFQLTNYYMYGKASPNDLFGTKYGSRYANTMVINYNEVKKAKEALLKAHKALSLE